MPQSCVAFGCNNRGRIEGVTYHRFPTDEELRRKWVVAVERKEWTPSEHSRLCSAHFREKDLDKTLVRLRLREGAVPCIFPALSNEKDRHGLKRKNVHNDTEVVTPQCVKSPTKKKLKVKLVKTKSTSKEQNTKIKTLQQRKRNLEDIVESLREKTNIQAEASNLVTSISKAYNIL